MTASSHLPSSYHRILEASWQGSMRSCLPAHDGKPRNHNDFRVRCLAPIDYRPLRGTSLAYP